MRGVPGNNGAIIQQAQYRASEMKIWPSPLEEKMKVFLDVHGIKYEQQKIIYIYDKKDIIRYYIADFYLPESNIIIEVDGKFHDKHRQKDRDRTKDIQTCLPGVEVLRFNKKDLSDKEMLDKLLCKIGII